MSLGAESVFSAIVKSEDFSVASKASSSLEGVFLFILVLEISNISNGIGITKI